ncbi:MAG: HEAT repeat domain-containing protein [Candidatus Acidiferrum sp.]
MATNSGLDGLKSALTTILQLGDADDQINAMRLLGGFTRLDTKTLTIVSALSSSSNPGIALTALGNLLKTGKPDSVAKFRRYIDAFNGNQPPIGLIVAAGELGLVTDARALPDLESLSGSRFLSIRIAAMDAIRHIASPKSAPVLVQRLDDPSRVVQYSALITLAEIFGKGGDYGPSAELFDKNPQQYIRRWKDWWVAESPKVKN